MRARAERHVVVALRADALIFRQREGMDDFAALGAFLPEALRHLAFFMLLRLERAFQKLP